jgi:hypothetical protein
MDINATATLIPAEFPTPFRGDAISPEVATALRRCAKRIRRFGEANQSDPRNWARADCCERPASARPIGFMDSERIRHEG